MSSQLYQMPTSEWLLDLFKRVDRSNDGQISAVELQNALSNGSWHPFNYDTVRLMIGIFDKDKTGTINYSEFEQLWKFVTEWLNCFANFDRDRSGSIDRNELRQALTTFGYRLSDRFYQMCMRKFDREMKGSINFDDFLQLMIMIQTITREFGNLDTDLDGKITIDYESFVILLMNLVI